MIGELLRSARSSKSSDPAGARRRRHRRAGRPFHGLIRPNGSGKSTLLKAIAGAHFADSGTIVFEGRDITRATPYERARAGLALKFQIAAVLPELSVYDNVLLATQSSESLNASVAVVVAPASGCSRFGRASGASKPSTVPTGTLFGLLLPHAVPKKLQQNLHPLSSTDLRSSRHGARNLAGARCRKSCTRPASLAWWRRNHACRTLMTDAANSDALLIEALTSSLFTAVVGDVLDKWAISASSCRPASRRSRHRRGRRPRHAGARGGHRGGRQPRRRAASRAQAVRSDVRGARRPEARRDLHRHRRLADLRAVGRPDVDARHAPEGGGRHARRLRPRCAARSRRSASPVFSPRHSTRRTRGRAARSSTCAARSRSAACASRPATSSSATARASWSSRARSRGGDPPRPREGAAENKVAIAIRNGMGTAEAFATFGVM